MEFHLTATGCHLPYGITQCYLPPDTSEHSTPRLNPSQTGRYRTRFTYPWGIEGWVDLWWLVTYRDMWPPFGRTCWIRMHTSASGVTVTWKYSAGSFYPENYFELFRVHIHHTGRVRWWFGGVMETSCHLDGTLFPFDSQTCSIVIMSWAYSEDFVDLRNASDEVHLEEFEGNGT